MAAGSRGRRREEAEVEAVMAEVTSLLQQLVELMAAKNAEGSSPATGGRIVVPQADRLFKPELMPNDVKLNSVSKLPELVEAGLVDLEDKGFDGVCSWNG